MYSAHSDILSATAVGKTLLEGEKVTMKGVPGLNLLVTEALAENDERIF